MLRSPALWLALAACFVYNVNLRELTTMDTHATRYLPLSVMGHFDIDLDEFPALHRYPGDDANDPAAEVPYFLQHRNGRYLPTYPFMPGVLSVPVYAPAAAVLHAAGVRVDDFRIVTMLSKLSASFAVAGSVAVMYLCLLRLTTPRRAVWIALIYAFATCTWTISSQGLWQTAWSQPMLAVSLLGLVRARERDRSGLLLAGLGIALSVACRPPNVLFAAVLSAYVLHAHRGRAWPFFVWPAVIGGLLVAVHLHYYGNLTGGYTGEIARVAADPNLDAAVTPPRWQALLGILVSPSRGLFVYSPVLLFAAAGLVVAMWRGIDLLLRYVAIATVLMLVFYSTWRVWWAGNSYGYRFLVDLLPGLCLFLPVVWDTIARRSALKALFVAAAAFSVFVQAVGAFCWSPDVWYKTPRPVMADQSRLWDWHDPEWLRCLEQGPRRLPIFH